MADQERKCPDCGSAMEEGWILDAVKAQVITQKWHRGTPESSRLFGVVPLGGMRVDSEQMLEVRSFRCVKCGLLKSYAVEDET